MAIDLVNSKGWFRINGGNWDGSGTDNPATNTGGINIATLFPTNAAYALFCANNNAAGVAANFGTSAFSFTVPSGFSAWGAADVPAFAVPTAAFPRVQCPDPHFAQVVLLMGFEDVNGSTGAPGMTDESSHAHGVATDNGNAAISTAQFKFGSSSLGLNTNPALIKYLDSPDWQLAASNTDQYTIECWVRLSSFALDSYVLSQTSVGNRAFYLILRHTTGDLEYGFSSDGTNWNVYASTSLGLTTGNWYFLTVDKDATGKVRVYSNGVMVASGTPANSAMFNSTIELDIGALAGNNGIVGWMDELRITKGTARYASDAGFAVPTARFPRS
jgi:hypothetical protein